MDYLLFRTRSGEVEESTHAMAKYKFKIVEEFQILICHLMKRKDVDVKQLKTIMATTKLPV